MELAGLTLPIYAGYVTLFVWIFLGEAGVPLLAPTELVLVAGGVAAGQGVASLPGVLALALTADVLGTLTLFHLVRGARRPRWLPGSVVRLMQWGSTRAYAFGADDPVRVALARMVPLLRVPVAAGAALAHLRVLPYIAAAVAGGIVWVSLFAGGAYLLTAKPIDLV